MFEGFKRFEIRTSDPEVKIAGRFGGREAGGRPGEGRDRV